MPLALSVDLAWLQGAHGLQLHLRYTVKGDMDHLRLPTPVAPGPADGLWQHTCFEAFVGMAGQAAYREFNFSPSGQWAAYHFHDQRQRDRAAEAAALPLQPGISLCPADTGLTLLATLPLHALPAPGLAWELGLSAVIETQGGQLSYWALRHPGQRPDFHHRGGWRALAASVYEPERQVSGV